MSITAWAEYAWTRLRRMDYWNPAHIPTNAPAKLYRWNAPGLRNGRPEAHLKKLDDKVGTNNFSVRYFHRDRTQISPACPPCRPRAAQRRNSPRGARGEVAFHSGSSSLFFPTSSPSSLATAAPVLSASGVHVMLRAEIKRDTGYYPDTPLSLNHALMKDKPLRSEGLTPDNMSYGNMFGNEKKFGTLKTMGIKKINYPEDGKPAPLF